MTNQRKQLNFPPKDGLALLLFYLLSFSVVQLLELEVTRKPVSYFPPLTPQDPLQEVNMSTKAQSAGAANHSGPH